jgi:DNA-binding response OmpR family regulator
MARILLIDDDEPVRTVLRLMLVHQGHSVIEARNGREGLQLFQASNADLVITDLVMPETEGFEVLVELRKKVPRVKIMVITGGVRGKSANYLDMAMRLGADQVLAKPFSSEGLTAALKLLLPVAPGPGGPD